MKHCPIYVDEKRDCVVCKKRDGVTRQVYSLCSAPQCQGKHMHITIVRNCFQVFHTREFHDTSDLTTASLATMGVCFWFVFCMNIFIDLIMTIMIRY